MYAVNKNKKKYIDSYRRKKLTDVHVVNKKKKKKQRKYTDSYNRKEKMIDMHTINQKKKAKKVYRFLQYRIKK